MNGLGPIILFALVAQVSAPRYPAENREFGWMRDREDNALVYIVQVSPTEAAQMEKNRYENLSNIPPELVGRFSRVSVRIGTDILPQEPSLEEIKRLPRIGTSADITSAMEGLGAGKIADLESSPLINVQDPGRPALPNLGGAPTAGNFADRTRQAAGNLIDQAKQIGNDALAPRTAGESFLAGANGLPDLPSTSQLPATIPSTSSKYENTGRSDSTLSGANAWNPQTSGGRSVSDRVPPSLNERDGYSLGLPGYGDSQNVAGGNFGARPASTNFANSGATAQERPPRGTQTGVNDRGYGGEQYSGSYGGESVRGGQARGRGGSFASARRGYGGETYGNGRGQGAGYGRESFAGRGYDSGYGAGYAGGGYGGGTFSRSAMTARLAQNAQARGAANGFLNDGYGLPNDSATNAALSSQLNDLQEQLKIANANATKPKESEADQERDKTPSSSDRQPQDTIAGSPATPDGSQTLAGGSSVLVQMFFLVSLVANVYLVYLIRKLLLRYRSLLSTVRGHAVT